MSRSRGSIYPEHETQVAAPPAGGQAAATVWEADRQLARLLLARLGRPPLRLTFWNGETLYAASGPPRWTVRFADRATMLRVMWQPDPAFGDAYTAGRITVEGDLVSLLDTAYRANRTKRPHLLRPRRNTHAGSRRNIHHHYDIGNAFYALWLDARMLYTCAYFPEPEMSLEAAQVAKMDHVCRKLQLRPGQRVIEAGCGWGALALHMAEHYGVTVQAFNISREQIAYARQRAEREGFADQVRFIEDDYRNITGTCDAFVSVGMLEHVGTENYRELGGVIDRCLSTEGRGLIHTIGRHKPARLSPWIERNIFPGAEPPTLGQMMDIFEPYDLSVLDVENLRLHYARTIDHWLERYEAARQDIATMFDERFVRAWRLYLAGSAAAFTSGTMQLFQVLFARHADNSVPWSRGHVYVESEIRSPKSERRSR